MLKVLSTLFDSNETYLSKHVAGINRAQAFPTRNLVNSDEFIRNTINDSIIVSGGSDEERSVLLLGLTRSSQGCVVIIQIDILRLIDLEDMVLMLVCGVKIYILDSVKHSFYPYLQLTILITIWLSFTHMPLMYVRC